VRTDLFIFTSGDTKHLQPLVQFQGIPILSPAQDIRELLPKILTAYGLKMLYGLGFGADRGRLMTSIISRKTTRFIAPALLLSTGELG
jgi:hypothetical protein